MLMRSQTKHFDTILPPDHVDARVSYKVYTLTLITIMWLQYTKNQPYK